jgi:hypothetical protein
MWLAVFLASFLIVGRAAAATYYFSSATGSDARASAQAQSKLTPWAHLPCMANATGNAAAYRPVAGDILVLKGGETWGNASFPCNWQWSGTSTNRITVTVDPTWFTGTSWTHPKWDAEEVTITGTTKNTFLDMTNSNFGVSYVTFDNIEMTRFFWTGTPAFGTCAQIYGSVSTNVTLDHLYIHGWMHDTYANGTRDVCHTIIGNSNPPYNSGSVFQNGIVDGSDGTGGGDSGGNYLWPSWVNNVIHDIPNAIVQKSGGTISGNTIYNCTLGFDPVNHGNLLETLGALLPIPCIFTIMCFMIMCVVVSRRSLLVKMERSICGTTFGTTTMGPTLQILTNQHRHHPTSISGIIRLSPNLPGTV